MSYCSLENHYLILFSRTLTKVALRRQSRNCVSQARDWVIERKLSASLRRTESARSDGCSNDLAWIAQRLAMGTADYITNRLCRQKRPAG